MDPWDHVLPGRGRPLHHVHDPFYGRGQGQDRTAPESLSGIRPNEGQPAVSAFRSSKFPVKPTTFYTYDGRIASTFYSHADDSVVTPGHYEDTPHSSSKNNSNQGHKGQGKKGRDGQTYYFRHKQHLNQSPDSGLRELAASTSSSNLHTPKKHNRKKDLSDDAAFQWHSTPIRQSSREGRQQKTSLPRAHLRLRRSSLDNTHATSPNESLSWAGMEPPWRTDSWDLAAKRRSGSYDELETRNRRRYDSTGYVGDDLDMFNWMPSRGHVITLDHNPSST